MNFSIKTEYALRAIYELSLAGVGTPVNREIIAKNQGIPIHFLETILIALKKAGLVRSVRGPGGGFALEKNPDDINVWQIYQAVDYKQMKGTRCFPTMTTQCEKLSSCKIKNLWFEFNESVKNNMSQLTIGSILS